MTTTTTNNALDTFAALAQVQARRVEKLRTLHEASKCKFTGSGAKKQRHLWALFCEARRALDAIEHAREEVLMS